MDKIDKIMEKLDVLKEKVKYERVQRVDPETGEIITEHRNVMSVECVEGGGVKFVALRDKHFFNKPFVTVFQESLLLISKQANLTKNEMRLLVYFIATCGADNRVEIDLPIISEELKIAKPNVSTALKGLVKRNIVIISEKNNYRAPKTLSVVVNYDQINYNLSYNGKTKDYPLKKKEHAPLLESDGVTLLEDHTKRTRQLIGGKVVSQESLIPNLFPESDD